MLALSAAALAAALPAPGQCRDAASDPQAAWAQAMGLQGYVYGYPIVDMLNRRFNETHQVDPGHPNIAPLNVISIHRSLVTPKTAQNLRAPNVDTLYLNAWVDLSAGPVLIDVPEMGKRYYTLAFMDIYGKPRHLGTRFNAGKASRYALIGPSGGDVPAGYEPFRLATDTVWMLGRVLVADKADFAEATRLARLIGMTGRLGPEPTPAEPARFTDSLVFFSELNRALKILPAVAGEEALMANFDAAGFGPGQTFDAEKLPAAQALGLGCALRIGPEILRQRGFKPTQTGNGWMLSNAIADPGRDFMLRAEAARGGYVNEPAESIYPAAITDSSGARLDGKNRYRIRFAPGQFPPVGAFWSITAYTLESRLVENPLGRYAIGDRTPGLRYGRDGSLDIVLSASPPREGTRNWLPIPSQGFHLVARLYLPRPEALDGRYLLPPVERIE